MKNTLLLIFTLATFLAVCPGCASIISKSSYPVNITSDPTGADISVTNSKGNVVYEGTTPAIVQLKAGAGYFSAQHYNVTFNKRGYETRTAPVNVKLDSWYLFGNIFFGGLVGWLIVDPITGAMYELEDLNVDLGSGAVSQAPTMNKLCIITLDQVPQHLRPRLVRIN